MGTVLSNYSTTGREIYKRNTSGNSIGLITRPQIVAASNLARRKLGLPTHSGPTTGRIAHSKESSLLWVCSSSNVIFAINTETNLGDTSRSFQAPFICEGIVDSGDTYPWIATGSQVKEWNGTAWVDKINQTTLRRDLGDSSTNIWSISRFEDDLFLVTTKHLHLYRNNTYVSSYNLPYQIAIVGAAFDF